MVDSVSFDRDGKALAPPDGRYAQLVESAEDAICALDSDGRFTCVNRAIERALRRRRTRLLGQLFTEFLPDDERDIDASARWRTRLGSARNHSRCDERARFA